MSIPLVAAGFAARYPQISHVPIALARYNFDGSLEWRLAPAPILRGVNWRAAASEYDFAEKKNVYSKSKGTASPFVLTQEVRAENE